MSEAKRLSPTDPTPDTERRGYPLPGGTADNSEQSARRRVQEIIDSGILSDKTRADRPAVLAEYQNLLAVIASCRDQLKRQKRGGLR